MAAIRRILVAVKDPSARRSAAVDKAAQLAAGLGASLELFHAISEPIYVDAAVMTGKPLRQFEKEWRDRNLERLEKLAAPLRERGVKVTTACDWDHPAFEAVVRRAHRARNDLIVAERHAKRHLAPWLLRFNDWELLRRGRVPVLLVKSGAAWDKPAVLAVGETHAPADAPKVASTTRRFTEAFLPKLEGRASDLVLELWVANARCNTAQQKREIKQVASQQREVTQGQAQSNQTEFLALYNTARQKKMRAHLLVPDCNEYARILDAGVGDVDAMLSMIARLTGTKIEELLGGEHAMIVAYGGAMHNDLSPRKGREAWSFGPRVSDKVGGQYVELDLIVPEFVGETDAWKSQPWYPHWKRGAQGAKTVLYTVRPGSYAMVFPPTGAPPPP